MSEMSWRYRQHRIDEARQKIKSGELEKDVGALRIATLMLVQEALTAPNDLRPHRPRLETK